MKIKVHKKTVTIWDSARRVAVAPIGSIRHRFSISHYDGAIRDFESIEKYFSYLYAVTSVKMSSGNFRELKEYLKLPVSNFESAN